MSVTVRRVEYFYVTVKDRPGEAYKLLKQLATGHVNLLAFTVVPLGGPTTQLTVFPESVSELVSFAEKAGLVLSGPQRAFLIQGDDELGALVEIHHQLFDEKINVYAANGVTDSKGGYGYVLHVRPEDYESAARVLEG